MSAIDADELTKVFGSKSAVDHLSFEIGEGEVFGLLGPNGAGKTTTIRMLACLISPSSGCARVMGRDVSKEQVGVRQSIGFLTENPALYERLTAYENLDFFAEAYGISSREERRRAIGNLLEFFGLWEVRNERTARFSKGMKQKLAVARALVHDPPVLLLDEPTSGLDPESSKNIRDLILRLSRKEGRTILLCTHHLEDAEKLCQKVMIIRRGRGLVCGTPSELERTIVGSPLLEVRLTYVDDKIVELVKQSGAATNVKLAAGGARLLMSVDDPELSIPSIVRNIVYAGGEVLSVEWLKQTLEEAYLKVIKEDTA